MRLLNRSKKELVFIAVVIAFGLHYMLQDHSPGFRRAERSYKTIKFRAVSVGNGSNGCNIPDLYPFDSEVVQYEQRKARVVCEEEDWVRCYQSKCRLSESDEILENFTNITCGFQDIVYDSNKNCSTLGPVSYIKHNESYMLLESDYVRVSCTGIDRIDGIWTKWSGNVVGLRAKTAKPIQSAPGQESINVLVLAFDSASRIGFWRSMPETWQVLTFELRATVMEGYSVLGDGTASGLLPTLTGRTDSELTDEKKNNPNSSDSIPFIFQKLKDYGYHTAFFEDFPCSDNIFQKQFDNFRNQPADHYLRAFFFEEAKNVKRHKYCVGSTPEVKLMLDVTEQFMSLDGNRFASTFIVNMMDSNVDVMASADDDIAALLRAFHRHREDTLLVVMSDHGPRDNVVRGSLQQKLKERLPFMALLLPHKLMRARPHAASALHGNTRVLTTPHDLHATLLDVLGMKQHAITHIEQGSHLNRGLTMLEPIPSNRSCADAGVGPNWCICRCCTDEAASDPYSNTTVTPAHQHAANGSRVQTATNLTVS